MSRKCCMPGKSFSGSRRTLSIVTALPVSSPDRDRLIKVDRLIVVAESSLLSAYRKAISEGCIPRIMLINSPSNPTGHVFSANCVRTIKEFCKSKEISLITDEIYSDICFDETQIGISAFDSNTDDSETVILTGGLSKVAGNTSFG